MPFPQPSEYDDAIQNPGTAFSDPELKQGINDGPLRFGMPGPVASGNFAVVYRFRCGANRYAVKCFTRQPPNDQAQRFSSIHNHLQASRLNCAVKFQFITDGIKVAGAYYPILKMEWLDAPTLLDFVPRNIHDREVFRQLSEAFLTLCGELKKSQIAHGDLQHGNLLVHKGGLKIIDYDGMCVPGTSGLRSEEDGLPHYQHPCRRGGQLAPNFDNFPSLVIWISLYALSIDPSLWTRYVREDERLLFSKDDFVKPQDSSLFRQLLSYGDERLTKAVTALRDACAATDLAHIPPLTEIVPSISVSVDPNWWRDPVTESVQIAENKPVSRLKHGQPDWMQSDEPPPIPVHFGATILWDRLLAYSYLLAVIAGVAGTAADALPGVLLGASIFGLLVGERLRTSYKKSPAVAQKSRCALKLGEAAARLVDYEWRLARWKAEQEALIEQMAQPVKEKETLLAQLQARSRKRQSELDVQLQTVLQALSNERQQINFRERQAVQALNNETKQMERTLTERLRHIEADERRATSDATAQINDLIREEERKMEAKYQAICDEFIYSELKRMSICAASIESLTAVNVNDLSDNGIHSAGDFVDCQVSTSYGGSGPVYVILKADGTKVRVPGIGWKRAKALNDWRRELSRRALSQAPKKMPANFANFPEVIKRETEQRRKDLSQRLSAAKTEAIRLKNEAYEVHRKNKAELARNEGNAVQAAAASRRGVEIREIQERQNADQRKVESFASFEREIWQLQSVINPEKHKVDRMRCEYQKMLPQTITDEAELRISVSSLEAEMTRYKNITKKRYLACVFAFAKV